MDRTNGANHIDIGGGRRGFQDRNRAASIPGTTVNAEFLLGVQEELVGLIEALGLEPSAANRTQILAALRRLAGGNITPLAGSTATLTADHAGVALCAVPEGGQVVTLPAAAAVPGIPLRFLFVRTDAVAANVCTIQRAGSDTIDAASSLTIPVGGRVTLVSNGVGTWSVVGSSDAVGAFAALTDGPGALAGHAFQEVRVNAGGTALEYVDRPFEGSITIGSAPTASEVLLRHKMQGPVRFAAGLAGWKFTGTTNATADTVITAKRDGVAFGTITIAAGTTIPAFAASATDLVADEVFTLEATSGPTLANFGITIYGTRR